MNRVSRFLALALGLALATSPAAGEKKSKTPVKKTSKGSGTSASTGAIQGKVTVTAPPRKPVQAPGNNALYDKQKPKYKSKVLPEEMVVYLEKVPGKWSPPRQHAKLNQKYIQFTHRVMPVLAGTTVDFTNDDDIYHNVFSNSETNKSFDLGKKEKGQTASIKLSYPEVPVKVYCEIHSAMKSNVLVLQNPFFAVVEPGGTYRLSKVPPGTYKLILWHDYWVPLEQTVSVKKGAVTKQDLTVKEAQY